MFTYVSMSLSDVIERSWNCIGASERISKFLLLEEKEKQ